MPETERRVQIVIPVRGAHTALRLCLECLYSHTDPEAFELALPHAKDEHESVCHEWGEAVNLAGSVMRTSTDVDSTTEPQSFARNCNLGATKSRSEFVVFLNSDAFVGPGWLDAILAPFADPDVVAVGPMGTNVSGIQGSWIVTMGSGEPTVEKVAAAALAHQRGGVGIPGNHSGEPIPVRRLVGFCLAVRRSAWDEVGGFDERFVMAFEDDDLCLRLSMIGDCVVVPDLLVLHHGQASFSELPDALENYQRTLAENEVRFYEKWHRRGLANFLWAWLDSRGVR